MLFTSSTPIFTGKKNIFISYCFYSDIPDSNKVNHSFVHDSPSSSGDTRFATIYVEEVIVNDQHQVSVSAKYSVTVPSFASKILSIGSGIHLDNHVYLFYSAGFLLQSFIVAVAGGGYSLNVTQTSNVYDSNFDTAEFLNSFSTNPVEEHNYLMFTSSYN